MSASKHKNDEYESERDSIGAREKRRWRSMARNNSRVPRAENNQLCGQDERSHRLPLRGKEKRREREREQVENWVGRYEAEIGCLGLFTICLLPDISEFLN